MGEYTALLNISIISYVHTYILVHLRISLCGQLHLGTIFAFFGLQWRHNDHGGVSNHQPHGCLLNRLFRHRSKKTSKLPVTGLCAGNSPGPVNSSHKRPVTRKMVQFDDVIVGVIYFHIYMFVLSCTYFQLLHMHLHRLPHEYKCSL